MNLLRLLWGSSGESALRDLAAAARASAAQSSKSPYDAAEYRSYLEERRSLNDAQLESAKALDQGILLLSGGAFGLSVVFVKDLFGVIEPRTASILYAAWIYFGTSLLATLFSFWFSVDAYTRQVQILETEFFRDREGDSEGGPHSEGESKAHIMPRRRSTLMETRTPDSGKGSESRKLSFLPPVPRNWYSLCTRYLNLMSLLSFASGLAFMAWFTAENLVR